MRYIAQILLSFLIFVPGISFAFSASEVPLIPIQFGETPWERAMRYHLWQLHTGVQRQQSSISSAQSIPRRIRRNVVPWNRSVRRIVSASTFEFERAIDGSIFVVREPSGLLKEVRILGVEAPEILNATGTLECFSGTARDRLAQTLMGRTIDLRKEEGYHYDSRDRMVRYVYAGGRDIGAWMIRNGYAFSDKEHTHSKQAEYNELELEARSENLGLWGGICDYD